MKNVSLAPQICENDFSFFSLPTFPRLSVFGVNGWSFSFMASVVVHQLAPQILHCFFPWLFTFSFFASFMGLLKSTMGIIGGSRSSQIIQCVNVGRQTNINLFLCTHAQHVLFSPIPQDLQILYLGIERG